MGVLIFAIMTVPSTTKRCVSAKVLKSRLMKRLQKLHKECEETERKISELDKVDAI